MIRILLVDDRKSVLHFLQKSLANISDLEIVGFASNGQSSIENIEKIQPDVVLMDIEMPIMDGLTATKIISERFINTKVIILTINDRSEYLNRALQVGAKGYILKTTPPEEIADAIRSVYKGYFQLGPGLLEKYFSEILKISSSLSDPIQLNQAIQTLEKSRQELNIKVKFLERQIQEKINKKTFFYFLKNWEKERQIHQKRLNILENSLLFFVKYRQILFWLLVVDNLVLLILLIKSGIF